MEFFFENINPNANPVVVNCKMNWRRQTDIKKMNIVFRTETERENNAAILSFLLPVCLYFLPPVLYCLWTVKELITSKTKCNDFKVRPVKVLCVFRGRNGPCYRLRRNSVFRTVCTVLNEIADTRFIPMWYYEGILTVLGWISYRCLTYSLLYVFL